MNNDDMDVKVLGAAKDVVKDVYTDTVKPTAKNVGDFFGTLSGFFSNVVLYPLKKLNIKYQQRAIAFEKQMQEKYNNIPEDDRVEPQLHIVGPAMESLKYNIMDEDLSEMFSNLLVSNLDGKTQKLCTPAFINIIEQLSPIDAKVYKEIMCDFQGCKIGVGSIEFAKRGTDRHYVVNLPKLFLTVELKSVNNYDLVLALENLQRVGLIGFSFTEWWNDEKIYETIKQKTEVLNLNVSFKNRGIDDYEITIRQKGVLEISGFSNNFAKVCLRDSK